MTRIIFSAFLLFCSLATFGQELNIPAPIQVPKDSKLILHVYAKGMQVYFCKQDTKDTSKYLWVFKGPVAVLYDDPARTHAIGKHYFDAANNATWEDTDGSKVAGTKVQQVNSPDSLAIPWLLVKAINTQGPGVLKAVTYVQRILTKGGKAPAKADASQKGEPFEAPYEAEYLFYSE
jgi:hypothetical protein